MLDEAIITRSIECWQNQFRTIYGRRNLYTSSASGIVLQMGREMSLLNKSVNTGRPDDPQALAGLGARIFALGNFLGEDVGFLLARKYPGRCPYCDEPNECACPLAVRKKHLATDKVATKFANNWHIDEAQRMLARLYGRANARSGREGILRHLNEEYLELARALSERDPESLQEELADVFAWWIGYITLRDIPSVSGLLYAHYPDV